MNKKNEKKKKTCMYEIISNLKKMNPYSSTEIKNQTLNLYFKVVNVFLILNRTGWRLLRC